LVPETGNWVPAVRDAPFGTGDILFAGSQEMAELIIGFKRRIRIGNGKK
jgi:hypothetical protein